MSHTFIALGLDLAAMSARALSAYSRHLGHDSRILFVPTQLYQRRYEPAILERIVDTVRESDWTGLTVFTSQFGLATQITEAIRKVSRQPIIWGGIHTMIRPDECLQHADAICMGEGEHVLAGVLEGRPFDQIPGLWCKHGEQVKSNGIGPMVGDISALPFQDFSFENHFLVDPVTGETGPMTRAIYSARSNHSYQDLSGAFRVYYKTMSTRGCPYACSYCNNSVLQQMYTNKHFRRRSVARVIEELIQVRRENPCIELIHMADDSFLNRSERELIEFSALYKEHVGLPLRALTTPTGLTVGKLEALTAAGLCHLYMGIESGSPRALKRYNRNVKPERVIQSAMILNRFKDRLLSPKFDVITNDPLATDEELYENLVFLSRLPRPRIFQYYSLGLFHGTKLRQVVEQQQIPIAEEQPYENDYFFNLNTKSLYDMLLVALNLRYMPCWLVRFLAHPFIHKLSIRQSWVNRLVAGLYRLLNGLETGEFRYGSLFWYLHELKHAITTGDWSRFSRFFLKLLGKQQDAPVVREERKNDTYTQ